MTKEIQNKPDIVFCLKKGFDLYKDNFSIIFCTSLIATFFSLISNGVCAGALFGGTFVIILSILRGDATHSIKDVFKGFDLFLTSFLAVFIIAIITAIISALLNIIPILGLIISLALCVVSNSLIVLAILLVYDQKAELKDIFDLVKKSISNKSFWFLLLIMFISLIIGILGTALIFVGLFFTVPLGLCIASIAYEEAFSEKKEEEADIEDVIAEIIEEETDSSN